MSQKILKCFYETSINIFAMIFNLMPTDIFNLFQKLFLFGNIVNSYKKLPIIFLTETKC